MEIPHATGELPQIFKPGRLLYFKLQTSSNKSDKKPNNDRENRRNPRKQSRKYQARNKAEGRKLWESGAVESGGGGGGKGAVPRNIRPFAHYTVGPEGSRIGRT